MRKKKPLTNNSALKDNNSINGSLTEKTATSLGISFNKNKNEYQKFVTEVPTASVQSKINVLNALINETVIAAQGLGLTKEDVQSVQRDIESLLNTAVKDKNGKYYAVVLLPNGRLFLEQVASEADSIKSINNVTQRIGHELENATNVSGLSPRALTALQYSFGSSTGIQPATDDALANASPRIKELVKKAQQLDPGVSLFTIDGQITLIFSSQTQGQIFRESTEGVGALALGYVSKSQSQRTELGVKTSLSVSSSGGANLSGDFFIRF